jgi:regulatory protein
MTQISTRMQGAKNRPSRGRKIPRKITAKYLHNAGLAYLQKFAASSKGFETVLMRKVKKSCMHHKDQDYETCAGLVRDTVKKFERSGLLNDQIFAEGMVSSLRRNGKSKKAILMKMTHKGLANDLTAQKLTEFDEREHGGGAESEMTAALRFAQKKKLATKEPEKALAAMARAGFSYDIARKILNAELED